MREIEFFSVRIRMSGAPDAVRNIAVNRGLHDLPSTMFNPTSLGELFVIKSFVRKFVKDETGATMVEYGLMLALIAVVCLGAVSLVGTKASALFTTIAGSL